MEIAVDPLLLSSVLHASLAGDAGRDERFDAHEGRDDQGGPGSSSLTHDESDAAHGDLASHHVGISDSTLRDFDGLEHLARSPSPPLPSLHPTNDRDADGSQAESVDGHDHDHDQYLDRDFYEQSSTASAATFDYDDERLGEGRDDTAEQHEESDSGRGHVYGMASTSHLTLEDVSNEAQAVAAAFEHHHRSTVYADDDDDDDTAAVDSTFPSTPNGKDPTSQRKRRGRPRGTKDSPRVDKTKRGRPKGAKNKKGTVLERERQRRLDLGLPEPEKRSRGRPRGTTNKKRLSFVSEPAQGGLMTFGVTSHDDEPPDQHLYVQDETVDVGPKSSTSSLAGTGDYSLSQREHVTLGHPFGREADLPTAPQDLYRHTTLGHDAA